MIFRTLFTEIRISSLALPKDLYFTSANASYPHVRIAPVSMTTPNPVTLTALDSPQHVPCVYYYCSVTGYRLVTGREIE